MGLLSGMRDQAVRSEFKELMLGYCRSAVSVAAVAGPRPPAEPGAEGGSQGGRPDAAGDCYLLAGGGRPPLQPPAATPCSGCCATSSRWTCRPSGAPCMPAGSLGVVVNRLLRTLAACLLGHCYRPALGPLELLECHGRALSLQALAEHLKSKGNTPE